MWLGNFPNVIRYFFAAVPKLKVAPYVCRKNKCTNCSIKCMYMPTVSRARLQKRMLLNICSNNFASFVPEYRPWTTLCKARAFLLKKKTRKLLTTTVCNLLKDKLIEVQNQLRSQRMSLSLSNNILANVTK